MHEIQIEDAVMENLEILSQISLTEQERIRTKQKLEEILGYVEKLQDLQVDLQMPEEELEQMENVFGKDEVVNPDGREAVLANAPMSKNGCYLVPKTI